MSVENTILLDNGAYEIKASLADKKEGLADTAKPKCTFNGAVIDKNRNQTYIGNKAFSIIKDGFDSRTMTISHPQVRGLLQDSDL